MYEYLEHVKQLIAQIERSEAQSINATVDLLTNCIKQGNSIYAFGASHAGILTEELFYRAGGLAVINPIFGNELMLNVEPITQTSKMERLEGYGRILAEGHDIKAGDCLIVHSVSGRNPVALDLVLAAKKYGAQIIAVTNVSYSKSTESRHSSGKHLYELADIVLDNHGDIGDACVSIEGLDQKVSPTSTVIGACILNTVVSEVARKLAQEGFKTPVYFSANIDGGDEHNREIIKQYRDQIHYRFD